MLGLWLQSIFQAYLFYITLHYFSNAIEWQVSVCTLSSESSSHCSEKDKMAFHEATNETNRG